MNFNEFCEYTQNIDNQEIITKQATLISYKNSKGEMFHISPLEVIDFLTYISMHYNDVEDAWRVVPSRKDNIVNYEEKSYRAIYNCVSDIEDLKTISTTGKSQTKSLTSVISKIICFLTGKNFSRVEDCSFFDLDSINLALESAPKNIQESFIHHNKVLTSNLRNEFYAWLTQEKGLSHKTAAQYSGICITSANALLGASFDFYNVSSLNEAIGQSNVLATLPDWIDKNARGNGMYQTGVNQYIEFLTWKGHTTRTQQTPESLKKIDIQLPKPFLLLAGISGTGKTRFVRDQAGANAGHSDCFCQVAVRPDWHDPADLLGYTTRLAKQTEYVSTEVLQFMVRAWKAIIASVEPTSELTRDGQPRLDWYGRPLADIPPYWLCLDEMNLAPVEQYFADYLSALETRQWLYDDELASYNARSGMTHDYYYRCQPLLSAQLLGSLDDGGRTRLRNELGLPADGARHDAIWNYFLQAGIAVPFNLIVAGTVNMDETTHGFSRKVIDRALTLDFGIFFPVALGSLNPPAWQEKTLGYPTRASVTAPLLADKCPADPVADKTFAFLTAVNNILAGTPFELAYRAQNELLLALCSFQPADERALMAVWDDFMMSKVLPRIEGDSDKLAPTGNAVNRAAGSLLLQLGTLLGENPDNLLPGKWQGDRPDLLREAVPGTPPLAVPFRTPAKLAWMQARLESNGFTSFWP